METLYRAGLSNAVSATVLALVVASLGRVLWRRPAIVHCLWLLVLLKLVTPPLYQVPIPWIKAAATTQASWLESDLVVMDVEESTTSVPDDDRILLQAQGDSRISRECARSEPLVAVGQASSTVDWMRLGCLIWIAGTLVTISLAIGRIRRFQMLLREAEPAEAATQEWIDDLARGLGLDRSPSVWWVAGKVSPLIWSLGWRPRLILPKGLWKGLDDDQRATLIIHEIAHLRRGDHRLRFFELTVTALYWWHPVLWWARRALRDVEEQCCDAWVVWALPDAVKSYADTLMETLDFLNPCDLAEPLLASGFGKVHHLRKRLTMIMTGTTPRLIGLWGTLGTLALALLLLPINAGFAQKADEKKSDETSDVRVIVTTDGVVSTSSGISSSSSSSSSSASSSSADGDATELVAELVTVGDGEEPNQVRVTVKSDDSEGTVVAGSLKEAMGKLKAQIGEIAKKSPQTDGDNARRKAMEQALKKLEEAAEQVRKVPPTSDKAKQVRAIAIRRIEDKNLSPEKKAEIDKATAKVFELRQAVQAKQKELSEAQANLMKLQLTLRLAKVIRDDPTQARVRLRDVKTRDAVARGNEGPFIVGGPLAASKRDDDPGEKRIDALEKRLEKLLEEVASLKKDRAK